MTCCYWLIGVSIMPSGLGVIVLYREENVKRVLLEMIFVQRRRGVKKAQESRHRPISRWRGVVITHRENFLTTLSEVEVLSEA